MLSSKMVFRNLEIILLCLITLIVNGQDDGCEKLIVGIYNTGIDEELVRVLNEKYGTRSELEWRQYADEKVLEIFQNSTPEIEFFSKLKGESREPDYMFIYYLDVIAIDTDILIPVDSICYVDPLGRLVTEYTDPVYDSESGIWMLSRLVVNSPCHPILRWILQYELNKNLELDAVIHENLMSYYRINNVIDEHEARKSAPAREPEMEIELEKDYLSPLDEESRQMELYVKVKDCHGRYVYYPGHSNQPVYYQKQTGRCDYKNSIKCSGATDFEGFATVLINPERRAIGEYHLREGLDPAIETVTLKTCGISNRASRSEVKEIVIRGLEIKVRPVRKEIYQDEQTEIILSFNEKDPDGQKEPISGKELEVRIEGLTNGEITPKSGYVTDFKGEVRLNYKAGDRDENIRITASYQPPDYPDKATGRGSVIVKPPEYDATLMLKKTLRKQIMTKESDDQYHKPCNVHTEKRYTLDEYIEASIYVMLKLEYVTDMPLFNQRWEYYKPIAVNLSNFDVDHDEENWMYGNSTGTDCASGGYETSVRTRNDVRKQEIQEPPAAPWIVAFDNNTEIAVKLIPGGYSILYDLEVTEVTDSRQWSSKGPENDSKISNTTRTNLDFGVGPVEDLEPDPTAIPNLEGIYDYLRQEVGDSLVAAIPVIPIPPPNTQEIPEIPPDILVQFGDGKGYFGGIGEEEIREPLNNGYKEEKQFFIWQMTRKKRKD